MMHAFGCFPDEVELATEVFFDPYPEDLVVRHRKFIEGAASRRRKPTPRAGDAEAHLHMGLSSPGGCSFQGVAPPGRFVAVLRFPLIAGDSSSLRQDQVVGCVIPPACESDSRRRDAKTAE